MEKIQGRVMQLATLVNYQAGSVVSRTLIGKETGTVTLFAFAEGQELSEHTAPYDALVIILAGEAQVTISGQSLQLGEGDMVIMPAHEPHALKALTKFKMLLVMIRS